MNGDVVQGETVVCFLGGSELYEGVMAICCDPGRGDARAGGVWVYTHLGKSIIQKFT